MHVNNAYVNQKSKLCKHFNSKASDLYHFLSTHTRESYKHDKFVEIG